MSEPKRHYIDLEQGVFRACNACAGAVNVENGQVACALEVKFPCVLLEMLSQARAEKSAGGSEIADNVSEGWIEAHIKTQGPFHLYPSPQPPPVPQEDLKKIEKSGAKIEAKSSE